MNTLDTTHIQPMLFPDMNPNAESKYNYQIKRMDNSSFRMSLTVTGEEDPEILALEQLGYFVVPEVPSDI
jgi:hypothetical protein